nr:reverse transcriptase domain-containing protein [Tanacetum cinerariifolium]
MDQYFNYSNSFGFDQYQPPQSSVTQQRSNEDILLDMAKLIKNNQILLNNNIFPHEETSMGVLLAKERILKLIQAWDEKQIKSWSLLELLFQFSNDSRTIDEMLKQRVKQPWERFSEIKHAFTDKQYQPEEIQGLMRKLPEDVLYLENSSKAIAPVLPTEEPEYSLSMGNEHLDTILETESDELFKSSVENLVPIPSEYEVTSDNEKIISTKIDPHYFNAESILIESLLNRDTLIDSSPKFDYLLELAHISPIPSGIEEADFDLEEEIRLVENLSCDNSSPRPPEELNAEIADTIVESLSPSPIPVEDSDSRMEEIDLFLATDDLMPPGIENDDYDSEGDIYFLEELFSNDPIPLPKNESSNFDHHDDPSFPRPPLELPDVEVFFDFEPDSGELISVVMNNIDELIEDECFDPGGGEIDVFENVEDDDYFPFIFVIRFFLPHLTYPERKLSLPELTPTWMTLELADRSITRPKGVAEDVFVKVGKFHFPTDFVVVDFEVDPRVPLILGRPFLRTGHALIDVYGEEITLRVNDEIRGVCSGNSWFSNNSLGGNPTSNFESILSYSSPSLTPFVGSDFILEEIDAYLKDESISLEIDHADCDPEGDIFLIEKLLNNDPFQVPPMDLK